MMRGSWQRRVAELAGARLEHAPIAWDALSQRWLGALDGFIRADASRLNSMKAVVVAVEEDIDAQVSFPSPNGPVTWRLRGRVDRILATPDGFRIEDYKTKASVEGPVSVAAALKGQRLQGMIYSLLGEEWAKTRANPLSDGSADVGKAISVAFLPVHPDAESFEPKLFEVLTRYRESSHETLAVLDAALTSGAFAFRSGPHCDWCAVRAACRRNHVPSQERRLAADEFADYVDLGGKSSRALSLEAARARRGALRDRDDAEDA